MHSCGIAIGRNINISGGNSNSTNGGVIAIGDRIFGTSDSDSISGWGTGPTKGIYIGSAFEKDTQNAYYQVGAMIGKGLKLKNVYGAADNTYEQAFIVGQYNDSNLPDVLFAIGCGTDGNNRKNALSVSNTKFKVLNDLQLNADNTSVNAITAPLDPSNPTTDEQTLATKAYVVSQIPTVPTDLVLATSYGVSAGNETLTPNTPVTLATIIGDNSWVFPYPSGTLKIFFKYPLISKIVCEATFLIDGTTTSGKVNSSFSYCINNGHDVGYIKGGLICLDYSTMSIELKYGEGIDVSNIDEAINAAYTDNTTTATLVRIHCTNLY